MLQFESFYHNRFNGRKLTWLHHLCQAELRLGYLKKPYVVTVQTFQMAILLLFETTDSISCKEIRETLQLNADQFQRHVITLVDSKLLLADTEVIYTYSFRYYLQICLLCRNYWRTLC